MTFTTYRARTALLAIITTSEALSEELRRARPSGNLASPAWLDLFDAHDRRREAIDRYNVATGTAAGHRLARTAMVYASDKRAADAAWRRAQENARLFPARATTAGAESADRRARDTFRRIVSDHEQATR